MKKLFLLMCAVAMLSFAAVAQKATSYAGVWRLDKERSKLDQRAAVESMTWTVTQTPKELKIVSEIKRPEMQMMPPPANAPAGMTGGPPPQGPPMGGGRGMGRGFGMGGDGTSHYSLDGKETIGEVDGPMGKMPVTYKATPAADGSIVLTNSRSFTGPNGEIKMSTKETWRLSADGKTLTVDREDTTPRGARTSTMVFVKG